MTDNETTPALADPPIHQCPRPGSAIMPCCGRTPFEVPRIDGLTTESYLVTCGELTDEDWRIWRMIHEIRSTGVDEISVEWRAAQERNMAELSDAFAGAVEAVTAVFASFADSIAEAVTDLLGVYETALEKPAARRARLKAIRNALEYSQPWAPGVITRKSRKR